MNETKKNQTVRYFTDMAAHFKALAQKLRSDDRADEAVFAKVRMNVCDIFSSVFTAAVKTAGDDDGKVISFFLERMEQIPRSWQTSLANAQQHGESEKAHIESIKLDTAAQIRAEFERIWEVGK